MIIQALRYLFLLPMAIMTATDPLSLSLSRLLGRGSGGGAAREQGHVALFVFGDSILDAGNNDYLPDAPKSNFWPYGETFFHYATGRECDGRIIVDYIAEYANMPLITPYLQPNFTNYTNGVNFASAGAGVFPETRPGTLYLGLQVTYLGDAVKKLEDQLGDREAKKLVREAVYHFSISENDYQTFLYKAFYKNITLSIHDKEVFVGWVIGNYTTALKRIYGLGGRKFSIQNCGPVGCTPQSKYNWGLDEGCWTDVELLVRMHNQALTKLLPELAAELPGFKYALFDFHTSQMEMITNYTDYGLKVGNTACCGSGKFNGDLDCGNKPDQYNLCSNPNEYLFFDSAHPGDHANSHLSALVWSGESPVIGPYNVKAFFEDI